MADVTYRDEVTALAEEVGLKGDPLGLLVEKLAEGHERIEYLLTHLDTSEIAQAAAEGAWRSSYHVARVHARRLDRITLAIATLLLFGAFFLGVLVGSGRL